MADTCSRGCNRPVVALGYCVRCYQQNRRGVLGQVKHYTPDGEASEMTFRLPKADKDRVRTLAERLKCDAADLYRRAVKELLANLK